MKDYEVKHYSYFEETQEIMINTIENYRDHIINVLHPVENDEMIPIEFCIESESHPQQYHTRIAYKRRKF